MLRVILMDNWERYVIYDPLRLTKASTEDAVG